VKQSCLDRKAGNHCITQLSAGSARGRFLFFSANTALAQIVQKKTEYWDTYFHAVKNWIKKQPARSDERTRSRTALIGTMIPI
jgi:hypothetical protein